MTTSDDRYMIRRGEQANELQAQYVIDCPRADCDYSASGAFRRQSDAYRELAALMDEHVRSEHRGWN